MANFMDELAKGFGDAVTDIRQKVVEEPWFGRAVTERGEQPAPQEAEPQPSFGSVTTTRDIEPQQGERLWSEATSRPGPEQEQERGQDIDR